MSTPPLPNLKGCRWVQASFWIFRTFLFQALWWRCLQSAHLWNNGIDGLTWPQHDVKLDGILYWCVSFDHGTCWSGVVIDVNPSSTRGYLDLVWAYFDLTTYSILSQGSSRWILLVEMFSLIYGTPSNSSQFERYSCLKSVTPVTKSWLDMLCLFYLMLMLKGWY